MEKYHQNKENHSEKETDSFENLSDDPSRVMERKEKREYLRNNKDQIKFFSKESRRLIKEAQQEEDPDRRSELIKERDYVRFRRDQEVLFEDYLSDDFDKEFFADQLDDLREKEIKFLTKKYEYTEGSHSIKNTSKAEIKPIIKRLVAKDTVVYTDGWKSYDGLVLDGYKHYRA